jgi:transcriptional regulator with XRE-family HTH domain
MERSRTPESRAESSGAPIERTRSPSIVSSLTGFYLQFIDEVNIRRRYGAHVSPTLPPPRGCVKSMPTTSAAQRQADARLGRAIRAARHERGMTLAQVAAQAGLSQPFLSQLELGRTRPSMRSLYRIATALGTTQQALLGRAASPAAAEPVRADDAALVEVEAGGARLLLHDPEGADVTEFVGSPQEFGEFFRHGRRELLYVARGTVELELREHGTSRFTTLNARDSITYPGRVDHRFRQVGPETCVVVLVHTGPPDD